MKRLQEQVARVESQMQDMLDTMDRGRRGLNTEERTKWNNLHDEHDRLCDEIKAKRESDGIDAMRTKLAAGREPNNIGRISDIAIDGIEVGDYRMSSKAVRARQALLARDPHERAFHNYLHQQPRFNGTEGLEAAEAALLSRVTIQNAQSGVVGTQGGILIPQGFSDNLMEAMLWFGGIDGVVGEFETATGNPWPWPTINDTMNMGRIVGQNVQVTETDFVFNQVTFNAYIGSSDIVLIPIALIEDSYFDMDGLTARLLGTRLGRLLNHKASVGTGVAEPTGIITAAIAAGSIFQLNAGNTVSIAYNNLVDMEHEVDPSYRYNPGTRWMMSDTMLKTIKKLTDSNNRPLWQPGLTASFREGAPVDLVASKPLILDHPYIINNDVPVPAASTYSLFFGDMNCFKLRRVSGGLTVLRLVERYADYLQVGFTAFMRFDSNLIDAGTHPVAVMQQSAT